MSSDNNTAFNWDFFIARASADKEIAEDIFDRLISDARVFLDSRCLDLGDDWDVKLQEAQQTSLVTLVLISSHTDKAYYQREEIAAAIAMARDNCEHRVVPVYLNANAAESDSVPYGLRLKHGLTLTEEFGLDELRKAVLALHAKLGLKTRTGEGALWTQIPDSQRTANLAATTESIARKVLAEIENHRVVYQCPGMTKGCPEGALTSVKSLREAIQKELCGLVELNEEGLSAILRRMNQAARDYASYCCRDCEPDLGECTNCTIKHAGCVPALQKYQKEMKSAMMDTTILVPVSIPATIAENPYWLSQI